VVGGRHVQPKQPEVDVRQCTRDHHVTQLLVDLKPEFVRPRRRDVVRYVTVLLNVTVKDAQSSGNLTDRKLARHVNGVVKRSRE